MNPKLDYPFCIACADIGGTKIALGLVRYEAPDTHPLIEGAFNIATNASAGGQEVLTRATAALAHLINSASATVIGIGVGAAGCVSPQDGSISFANDIMPGWTGQPVAAS